MCERPDISREQKAVANAPCPRQSQVTRRCHTPSRMAAVQDTEFVHQSLLLQRIDFLLGCRNPSFCFAQLLFLMRKPWLCVSATYSQPSWTVLRFITAGPVHALSSPLLTFTRTDSTRGQHKASYNSRGTRTMRPRGRARSQDHLRICKSRVSHSEWHSTHYT